uniref:Zinc finger protein 511 n=1 Tax=Phocoena sinus TaxID=42100 RepID=A0A8C9E5S3_PHOSS
MATRTGGREPLQPGACAARGRERDPNHRLDARGQLRIEAAPGLTAGARPARARQARQARRAAPAAEVALYVTSGPAPAGSRTVADRPWRRWRSGRCSCHPRCTHAWRGHRGRPSLYPWSGTPRPGPRPSASRRARCASHGSTTSLRVPEFTCQVAGCCQVFDALEDYEHHYHTLHRNVCSFCKRAFPSGHLLDTHILEWHDSLFQILAERQDMYQCLVEGCTEKFRTSRDRKEHLVMRHLYPADFRFDKPRKSRGPVMPGAAEQVLAEAPGDDGVPSEGDAMEVCSEHVEPPPAPTGERRAYSHRIPPTICFGQGASRGFKRAKKRNKHQ